MTWLVHLRLMRRRLVGPAAIWLGFALLLFLTRSSPQVALKLFKGYLGLLPALMALLAPGLLLDDPALELVFTMPRRPLGWLLVRLALLFGLMTGSALLLWGWAVLMAGSELASVLGWATLLPAFGLSLVALCAGLLTTEPVAGAAVAGAIWFLELMLHPGLMARRLTRSLDLFTGLSLAPGAPLWEQQAVMILIGIAALTVSAWLIRWEERYL
jgi:hypothetical protein